MEKFFSTIFILICMSALQAQQVTTVYSNYNNFWTSSTTSISAVKPDNMHDLLGFTIGSQTYSTGVDDAILTANGVTFLPQTYQALPVSVLPNPPYTSTLHIGVGRNFMGLGNILPVPVTNDLASYLTDGANGLGLGSGIFNMNASSEIKYSVQNANVAAIGDGVPDIIVTQIGQIPSSNDIFKFVDAAGNLVGVSKSVNLSTVAVVGICSFKFYNPSTTGSPVYNPSTSAGDGSRDLRILTYDLADFGITASNIGNIAFFSQQFSGQSDQAFIAYNSTALTILQAISGTVYKDANGGTPDGIGHPGVTIKLFNASNLEIASTVTNDLGYYSFSNIEPGSYIVTMTIPNGYYITGSADGQTDENLNVIVPTDQPVTGMNFGINAISATPVRFGNISATVNNKQLTVNWSTLMENNFAHFLVEISKDGTSWKVLEKVGSKSPNANSTVELKYSIVKSMNEANSLFNFNVFGILLLLGFVGLSFGASSKSWYKLNKSLLAFFLLIVLMSSMIYCKKNTKVALDEESSKIYVRIAQVDRDGSIEYSKIIKVVAD